MKQIVMFFLIGLTAVACTSSEAANTEERKVEYAEYVDLPTSITFENPVYDFGEVTDGDMVEHTFKFTNSGDQNLVLFDVKTTCGCTVPEDWPKHPIAPGEGGEIKVIFNSNKRVGLAQKSIRVEANTNPTVTTVTLQGEVKAAE